VRRLGFFPIVGGDQHAVEQEQRIPIFSQEIGKGRPAAEQRLMRHFDRRRIRLRRRGIPLRPGFAGKLRHQQPTLGERAGERQQIGGQIALPRDAALRGLALTVNARKPRDEQPPQHLAPLRTIRPEAGIGERDLRFLLDRRRHAAGLLEFFDANRALSCVFSHQSLEHESEQRQGIHLAGDFVL
jgi:hypothetical protein